MSSILEYIKCPKKIIQPLGARGFLNWISDETYLKLIYSAIMGEKLNLDNPITFNEKLQWLKIHDRKIEYTAYADKFEVRKYICEKIGEEYLIPLLGVYDSVDEIDWEALPNSFVLKCTHGSHSNIICKDKSNLNIKTSKRDLRRWMKCNWFWYGREWPYKHIKPRIICETFILDSDTTPVDYKVLCFNGKAKLIEVHLDRFGDHTEDFYDENWHKTAISQGIKTSTVVMEKPKQLEKMLQLSEQLSANSAHLRVDWYIAQDKLYFGEMTFYDASGFGFFDNKQDDYLLGSWLNLQEK